MKQPMILVAVLGLAVLATPQQPFHQPSRPQTKLKEEKITIEFTTGVNEAVVLVEAEAEIGLTRVDIYDPYGAAVLGLDASRVAGGALQGFVVETRETALSSLVAMYPEGIYEIRARTVDGDVLRGSAHLQHAVPARPIILYPSAGETDVSRTPTVQWMASPSAVGYEVALEQGESDGLRVRLPAGTSSFTVPAGVLAPGTETQFEVGVIGSNGNSTLAEVLFTTH